ncbi:MAG: hypothetical protein M1603_00670, partial [Candidatus Marsarchaeota archaeon]|nr:hypothetical protein [Candidatus Marsarchaeota archaeon]
PIRASAQQQRKRHVQASEESEPTISIIKPSYSEDDAMAYAKRMASRHVIPIAGMHSAETVEGISTFYYPLKHFRILVPKRNSHEFSERYALLDPMARIASIGGKLRFVKQEVKIGAHISKSQERLLEQLQVLGKPSIEKIEKHNESRFLHSDIKALAGVGAIRLAGKHIVLNSGIKFASRHAFDAVEAKDVRKEDLVAINDKGIGATAKIIFPGCRVFDMGRLYIKMYKVTLRRKDRMRVFVVDSISFKDRPELVNIVVGGG